MNLDKRELATVLAALRLWQWTMEDAVFDMEISRHNPRRYEGINDIACEPGDFLREKEIDALCEKLNESEDEGSNENDD